MLHLFLDELFNCFLIFSGGGGGSNLFIFSQVYICKFHNFANPRKGGPYHLLTHSLPPAHISIRACIYNQEVFKNKKIIIQFADYTTYPVEVNVLKAIYSWNVCVKEYKVLIMSGCNVIFF